MDQLFRSELMKLSLIPVTDGKRHLICLPYSVDNLHKMAEEMGIGRHWFHSGNHPHYDIPKRRQLEIESFCKRVSSREILLIIGGTYADQS